MDFGLTDEQRALASTVRDFLADRFDLAAVRRVFEDPDGDGHPLDLWKSIGEQGWLAVLVPEEYDGLGLGLLRRGGSRGGLHRLLSVIRRPSGLLHL